MVWFQFILLVIIGAIFIFMGYEIWRKEKITWIHDYHYKKVSNKDKKAYTEKIGKSLTLIGTGILLTGIINFLIAPSGLGWIIFTITFIAGLILMLTAQKRYNHGIF